MKCPDFSSEEQSEISKAIQQLVQGTKGLRDTSHEEAVRTLWRFFCQPLKRYALSLLGGPQYEVDADDVIQDAFVDFLMGAKDGRWKVLVEARDLWALLVKLTKRALKRDRNEFMKMADQSMDDLVTQIDPKETQDLLDCSEYQYLLETLADETKPKPPIAALEEEFSLPPLSRTEAVELLKTHRRSIPKPSYTPAEPTLDSVDCTVFAPTEVCTGDALIVQVLTYLPSQKQEAESLAKEFDADTERRGFTSLEAEIERGSKLFFRLEMPGLKLDQRLRHMIWHGRPDSVQFRVVVPKNYASEAAVGTVTVSQDQVPLGQITFKLKVKSKRAPNPPALNPTGDAKRFDVFFISYASADRPEVLKRVQMLARLGKRFFQDLLSLDPGDRWKKKLYVYIDQSDAVLLFWSSNAKKSKWVMKECRYTIRTKGIQCLLPVIIEGPPVVKPPKELADLHMNDWLLHVIGSASPGSSTLGNSK